MKTECLGTDGSPVLSDRVRTLKNAVIEEPVRLSVERVKALLEVWRETEGQPAIIRSAKVLERTLRTMTLYIDENPIVGALAETRKGVQAYPEWSCHWLTDAAATSSTGDLELSDADKEVLEEAKSYFLTRCVRYQVMQSLNKRHPGVKFDEIEGKSLVFAMHPIGFPIGGVNVDYGKVLTKGMNGIIAECRQELAKLFPGYAEDFKRINCLEAMILSLEAVIAWAARYALLADAMAAAESDPQRKIELKKIAETCRRVPAEPARNFEEALQSFWLTHAVVWIEAPNVGHSPGRFCQYMYPFYKASKDKGEMTPAQAVELLELLFIKFSEIQKYNSPQYWQAVQQHLGQNLNVGGLTREGADATNELDYLVLDAAREIRLIQPSISLLWHDKLKPEFLQAALEVVKTGIGQPAFFNCDVSIARLMDRYHVGVEDARDFSVVACVDTVMSHAQDNDWEGLFGYPKILELALNNGKDPLNGLQLGPKTGDVTTLKTYEDIMIAMRKQLQYFMPLFREANLTGFNIYQNVAPTPYISSLLDSCIERGKELNDGGVRFSLADGGSPIGTIDTANSLAAIKQLVFEDKKITLPQLLDVLNRNFEGEDEIYRLCWNAPKYGNDDPYADRIVHDLYELYFQEHQKFNTHLNEDFVRPYALSVTQHFLCGSVTGALPEGRKARVALADGSLSAYPGTDVSGPTALLNSAVKAVDSVKWASHLLNMKFLPNVLASRDGAHKFYNMVKSYMDMGGYHIQFNVVSSDTLKDAQRRPEKYKDLVVRVAGFSAFFTTLTPDMQEEVIKRTEYSM